MEKDEIKRNWITDQIGLDENDPDEARLLKIMRSAFCDEARIAKIRRATLIWFFKSGGEVNV